MHQTIKNYYGEDRVEIHITLKILRLGKGGGEQSCSIFVSTGKFFTMLTYSFWILAVFFVRRHISTDFDKNKAIFFRSESDRS